MPFAPRARDWQAIGQVDSVDTDTDGAGGISAPTTNTASASVHAGRVARKCGGGIASSASGPALPDAPGICKSRRHFVVAVALVVFGVAAAAAYAKFRTNVAAAVPQYSLRVGFTLFDLAGYDVALMAYNGRAIGPTLVVRPGGTLAVRLVNRLPPNKRFTPTAPNVSVEWPCWRTADPGAAVPVVGSVPLRGHERHDPAVYGNHLPSEEAQTPFDYVNTPHAFRTTNLHTHGLQVPPSEDDPFLRVEPGGAANLSFRLPPDHPGGLFWYHPHGHGGVTVQTYNGLAGALVIPGDLEAAVAALPSVRQPPVLLAVQEVALVELGNASRADIAASLGLSSGAALPPRLLGNDPAPFACAGAARGGGFQYMSGFDLRAVSVAGVVTAVREGRADWRVTGAVPNVTALPGETLWLRVLNAAPTRALLLRVEPGSLATLRLALVAIDGITLPAPVIDPPQLEGVPLTSNSSGAFGGLLLPSGGRFDLLATVVLTAPLSRAALGGPRRHPTLWHATATCDDSAPLGASCPDTNAFPMLGVVVSGMPVAPDSVADPLAPLRLRPPARLPPISDAEVRARRRLVISQDSMRGGGHAPEHVNRERDPLSLAGMGYYINNRTFDPRRVDIANVLVGSAEEWAIDNPGPSGQGHPWHVHTHPFLIVGLYELDSSSGDPAPGARNLVSQPFWADSAWVPLGARLVTRMRFLGPPGAGRSVFHCHMLTHEDLGMMGVYEVVEQLPLPYPPVDKPFPEKITCVHAVRAS